MRVPTKWNDITAGQYVAAVLSQDESGFLASLCNVTANDILNMKIDDVKALAESLAFTNDSEAIFKTERPVKLKIQDKYIICPENLEVEKYGLYTMAIELIKDLRSDNGGPENEVMANILVKLFCIYTYMPFYGKRKLDPNDYEQGITDYEKLILQLPVTTVFPLGGFYLDKFLKSPKPIKKH